MVSINYCGFGRWSLIILFWVWSGFSDWLLMNRTWNGKNYNFTGEKPGRYHLSQMIKVNTISVSHVDVMYPLICQDEKGKLLLWYSSQNSIIPVQLIMKYHQTDTNWKILYKIFTWYSSKVLESWKTRRDRETTKE